MKTIKILFALLMAIFKGGKLVIENIRGLKTFTIPNWVRELTVINCPDLEEITGNVGKDKTHDTNIGKSNLTKLQLLGPGSGKITIKNFYQLEDFSVPKHLHTLIFQACNSLKKLTELEDSNLKTLQLLSAGVLWPFNGTRCNPDYSQIFLHMEELEGLPATMETLDLQNTHMRTLPFLHEGLKSLTCSGSEIKQLPKLPSTLTHLDVSGCNSLQFPEVPATLKMLVIKNWQWYKKVPKIPAGCQVIHTFGEIYGPSRSRSRGDGGSPPTTPKGLDMFGKHFSFSEIVVLYEFADQKQVDEAKNIQIQESTNLTKENKLAGKRKRLIGEILVELGYCTTAHIDFVLRVEKFLTGNTEERSYVPTKSKFNSQWGHQSCWSITGSLKDSYTAGVTHSIQDVVMFLHQWEMDNKSPLATAINPTNLSFGNAEKGCGYEKGWKIEQITDPNYCLGSTLEERLKKLNSLGEFLARNLNLNKVYITYQDSNSSDYIHTILEAQVKK